MQITSYLELSISH